MGITKQSKKDSPTAWVVTWLGFHLDTRKKTMGIPEGKQQALLNCFHNELMVKGGWLKSVNSKVLEKVVGTLCHFSQTWPTGKTLLWPLYVQLNEHRVYTKEGKQLIMSAMVELNGDSRASLDEWYLRVCTIGLERRFYSCRGSHSSTVLGVWMDRRGRKTPAHKKKVGSRQWKGKRTVRLISPWKSFEGKPSTLTALQGKKPMAQVVAMAIKLLLKFLEEFVEKCGAVIEIRTNVGDFCNYISKDCYPKGLNRESFIESVAINRLLDREGEDCEEEPRHLKTYFIY